MKHACERSCLQEGRCLLRNSIIFRSNPKFFQGCMRNPKLRIIPQLAQMQPIISSSGWSPAGPQCGDGKQTATREWLPAQCNCSLGPAWAATHMPCCRAAQRPSMGDGSAGGWARVDSIVDSDVGCARMKGGQRVGERRDIIIFSLSDGNEM